MKTYQRVYEQLFSNFDGHAYKNRASLQKSAYILIEIKAMFIKKAFDIISKKDKRWKQKIKS